MRLAGVPPSEMSSSTDESLLMVPLPARARAWSPALALEGSGIVKSSSSVDVDDAAAMAITHMGAAALGFGNKN